jgi:hypothetical protein
MPALQHRGSAAGFEALACNVRRGSLARAVQHDGAARTVRTHGVARGMTFETTRAAKVEKALARRER